MKSKQSYLGPACITALVIICSAALHALSRTIAERPHDAQAKARVGGQEKWDVRKLPEEWEARTYDARVKLGAAYSHPDVSGKIATLFFDNVAFDQVNDGSLALAYAPAMDVESVTNLYPRDWPWPRFIHGQIVRELAAQGTKAIGFDIMFPGLKPNCNEEMVPTLDGKLLTSDQFFAEQLAKAGNVYLAVQEDRTVPHPLFATNAAGLATIVSMPDYSVLRRAKPYDTVRVWHPLVLKWVKPLKLDLSKATAAPGKIIIPQPNNVDESQPAEIPLNPNGTMKLSADGEIDFPDDPDDEGPQTEFAYRDQRVWNLGLTLAAKALGLDLERPEEHEGSLMLRGANGLSRKIPLDSAGYFYIDWSIRLDDIKEHKVPIHFGQLAEVLIGDKFRSTAQQTNVEYFKDRVVIIGSIATGNNVTDVGGTPLDSQTMLVTKHVNIANSLLINRFVERTSLPVELVLIAVLGVVTAIVTWRLRVLAASVTICVFCTGYVLFTTWIYFSDRYWIPMVMPLGGGFILPHFSLITYRVVFEQREQRRVRGIFSKIVSPDIVQELLGAESLAALSGVRRTITVFFADVRGFTEFTDSSQAAAEEFVQKNNLSPEQTRVYYDQIAKEQLETVNRYLATIADTIKNHRGTLDKYMGDCVMAFWGAPIANEQHALDCVRAAIDAQRGLNSLNEQRAVENERRKNENIGRVQRGEAPLPPLALLLLGTGINTGSATVGLMGSDAAISNYTVFGREVNLASRLEGASGRGRILISDATLVELQRLEPALAASCIPQTPITPKGFRQPIRVHEVPWKEKASEAPKPAPETVTKLPA